MVDKSPRASRASGLSSASINDERGPLRSANCVTRILNVFQNEHRQQAGNNESNDV